MHRLQLMRQEYLDLKKLRSNRDTYCKKATVVLKIEKTVRQGQKDRQTATDRGTDGETDKKPQLSHLPSYGDEASGRILTSSFLYHASSLSSKRTFTSSNMLTSITYPMYCRLLPCHGAIT